MKCSDNTLIYSKGFFAGLGSAIFLQHIFIGIHFSDWSGKKRKNMEKHSYMVKYLFTLGGNALTLEYKQEIEATGR